MNFILRINVPSILNVVAQHTEVLIVILDLTPDISRVRSNILGQNLSMLGNHT